MDWFGWFFFFCQLCPINHFLKALNKETLSSHRLALHDDGEVIATRIPAPHPYIPVWSQVMAATGILPLFWLCLWPEEDHSPSENRSQGVVSQHQGPVVGHQSMRTVMLTEPRRNHGGCGAGAQARTMPASSLCSCAGGSSAGTWHGSLAKATSPGCLWRLYRMPTPTAASR